MRINLIPLLPSAYIERLNIQWKVIVTKTWRQRISETDVYFWSGVILRGRGLWSSLLARQEERALDVYFCYLEQYNTWGQAQAFLNSPCGDSCWQWRAIKGHRLEFPLLLVQLCFAWAGLSRVDTTVNQRVYFPCHKTVERRDLWKELATEPLKVYSEDSHTSSACYAENCYAKH